MARSALAQIVDGARRHQNTRALVEREANLGGVGSDDRSRLGLLAGVEYAHESATSVELLVIVDNVLKSQGVDGLRRERQRHRGEQAALERCQMRGEDDAIGQAKDLLNLGRVAMLAHAVGLQVLVGAAKMRASVAGLAGTRHTADGINDHGAALGNPASAHGGSGGKARCGGIATGAGDQHGLASGMAGSSGL